jgi:cell division protein FtsB
MERRQAAKVRRARATVVGAALVSGLILVLWFPAGSLLHQRAAINAAASELGHLQQQDRQLAQEQKALGSPAEIQRVARQQYQLISPGERAFLVLPPAGTKTSATQYEGDPANQPLVSPSAATELPPGGTTASDGSSAAGSPGGSAAGGQGAGATHGSAGSGSSTRTGRTPGFLGRVAQTLEFWR